MTAITETADNSFERHQVEFTGNWREYFGIWIVNILLTILTLGIYSAWAKVRRKRWFYGHTFIAGSSFDYHGRPVQILERRGAGRDHPVLCGMPETEYLKCWVLQVLT